MRECISVGLGLDAEGRNENNLRIARLAHILSFQKTIIVAVIAPFAETRSKIDTIASPIWIHLHRPHLVSTEERPYEKPEKPHMSLDTSTVSILDSANTIIEYITDQNIIRPENMFHI